MIQRLPALPSFRTAEIFWTLSQRTLVCQLETPCDSAFGHFAKRSALLRCVTNCTPSLRKLGLNVMDSSISALVGFGDSGKGSRFRTSSPREKILNFFNIFYTTSTSRDNKAQRTSQRLRPLSRGKALALFFRKSATARCGLLQSRSPAALMRSETNVARVRWHTHKAPTMRAESVWNP